MARQLKDLHYATCLAELQKKSAINLKPDGFSSKSFISTADKLYEKAEVARLDGDEELAYVFLFRYLETIKSVQKKDDYKKDKTYFDKLISKGRLSSALQKLEELINSLEKRYNLKKEVEDLDTAARKREYKEALENEQSLDTKAKFGSKVKGSLQSDDSIKSSLASLNGVIKSNGLDKVKVQNDENDGISPQDLKNLLDQKAKRLLLVDCRDQADFTKNHINHSNCICIPPTALSEGMSANVILKTLKNDSPESYMEWNKRKSFDFIILYDWNSSFDHRGQQLNIIYDALTKWDPECNNVKTLVIQGGMKNIYYTYPNLLTNPQTNISSTNKVNGGIETDLRKIELISYPDLEDKPKVVKPDPEASQSVNYNNTSNENGNYTFEQDMYDVPKSSNFVIDRSTKPLRKIPNGTPSESVLPNASGVNYDSPSKDKTEFKDYSVALDETIESAKNVLKKEKEMDDLIARTHQSRSVELEKELKMTQEEAENYKNMFEARNEQLKQLRINFEELKNEQKSKQILPKIRMPSEEKTIFAKQLEKERLENMVKNLRKARHEAEETKRQEELASKGQESSIESTSKLPPISSTSSESAYRGASASSTTQLPVINSNVKPSENIVPASNAIKPSSSNISNSSSRPTSQSQDSSTISRQKLKGDGPEQPRSSALKRSHSHPNIAQSHDDDTGDDVPGSSHPPRIFRGLKPSGSRAHVPEVSTPRRFARNFEVVSSTERSKTGLKNLGNTCYMNSIIQCLSHTIKLVDFLRNEEYIKEWHPSRSHTKGEATEELAAAVKQMHSGHRSISLLDLKSTVGKYHRSFRGYEQQDSHEFITILLDWLHEEMNRAPEKTPLKEQKNDGLTDVVASGRVWDDYKRSNDSKISELFCGQQKSCVTCGSCNRQSVTFEPFFILSVPIPSSGKKCDIQQCIDFYTTEEELSGWNCVHCKKKVRATKKIDLWRLPPYLIIHVQRFYFDGYWKKRLTEIDFPVDMLNLNNKVLGKDDTSPSADYQLYAVSNHYGSMDGGHYTAYCRLGNWWKFDDSDVCSLNSRDVPTAAAYILFYQNRNC